MNQYANDFTETVKTYYKELSKYKPLSKDEEKYLIGRCRDGDIDARNRLLKIENVSVKRRKILTLCQKILIIFKIIQERNY